MLGIHERRFGSLTVTFGYDYFDYIDYFNHDASSKRSFQRGPRDEA